MATSSLLPIQAGPAAPANEFLRPLWLSGAYDGAHAWSARKVSVTPRISRKSSFVFATAAVKTNRERQRHQVSYRSEAICNRRSYPLTPRPDCNHSSDWNDCCCLHQDRHCQRNLRKQRNWRRRCRHYRDRLCLLLCSTIRFFLVDITIPRKNYPTLHSTRGERGKADCVAVPDSWFSTSQNPAISLQSSSLPGPLPLSVARHCTRILIRIMPWPHFRTLFRAAI